ncbi:MAG: tryptophan--tRNA ligase, partial [Anaerolineales bacterium]|nr:tryptophan--tRNA ligase [Anaerolineales bacterium]
SPEEVAMIDRGCRDGSWGCVECKALLAKNLNKHLESFRTKRAEIAEKPDQVWDILHDGAKRARAIAEETMREVREAVQLPV